MKDPAADIPEDRFYNPAKINAWFAVSAILTVAAAVAAILADHYDRDWKGYQESFHAMERKRAEEALALESSSPATAPAEARAVMARLLRPEGSPEGPSALDAAAFEAALAASKADPAFPVGAVLAARAYAAEADALEKADSKTLVAALEAQRGRADARSAAAEKEHGEMRSVAEGLAARLAEARSRGDAPEQARAEADWKAAVGREAQAWERKLACDAERTALGGAIEAVRAYKPEAGGKDDSVLKALRSGLEALRDKAEELRFKAEKEQRELQALVDEHKFSMDHAHAQGHAVEAELAEKEWKETVALERETHARMDGFALEKSRRIEEMKQLTAPVAERRARATRLEELAGVAGAARKLNSFAAAGLRDAPLLNQFAPMTKIEQGVYPDLPVDYNFAKVPRVDRCMTCHSGIDKVRVDPSTGEVFPVYTAENTPERVFRTHPRPELFVSSVSKHAMDKVGCTSCHDGLGWGLTFADAYHTPSTPEQEKEWEEKYHWHRGESWDQPMLPQKYIEAACFKCHKEQAQLNPEDKFAKEIPSAPTWNRGLALVERHGCFGCHKIDGLAVAGLDKWIAEIKDDERRGYAVAASIRKTGPSLLRLASKWSSKEAAWKWIWHPQDLRPTTNMPRFFGQPNNSGVDPVTNVDYDLRTRTEVWGLVELLWSQSDPGWSAPQPPVQGDAARGRALFGGTQEAAYGSDEAADEGQGSVGCVACHATKDFPKPRKAAKLSDFGPELSTVGSKVPTAWLYAWLKNPYDYWHGTRMPSFRLTDQEAADLAAYLASLRNEEWERKQAPPVNEGMVRDLAVEAVRAKAKPGEDPEAVVAALSPKERLLRIGTRAVERYACYACHDIKGFENAERIGTELGGGEGWGSKDVDRLDFGLMEDPKAVATYASWNTGIIPERPEGGRALPHRKPEWAWLKLKNPRVFDAGVTKQPHEKLLMPNFHFTDAEADSVVTFLLSLQKVEIPATRRRIRTAREILAEKKNWLARQYNCYGCHTLKVGEAEEAWHAKEGKRLPRLLGRGGDIRPWLGDNKANWPPSLGGEGRIGEGSRVQPAWLFGFLREPAVPGNPNMLRFWMSTRMPTFGFTLHEINAIVEGFAAEDRVPFPFEFGQAKDLGRDEGDAKVLFDALRCASCHPTPADIAAGKSPSGFAPPLGFARARLRHQWVKQWLDNPKAILPGTGMPAFWRPEDALVVPDGAPEVFGKDPHVQIEKVADYVFGLGKPAAEAGTK